MGWIRDYLVASLREFISYSWMVQKRAMSDTARTLQRHLVPEVLIVLATALASVLGGPWAEWLSRVSAGLAGGLLAVLFLLALHYLFHLTAAPYRMFREV